MTLARGIRQILYTLLLVAFLKGCTPFLSIDKTKAAETPAVHIDATPKVQLALYGKTTQIYLKLTIPKDVQNRAVCVTVDGGVYRSSCWEIAGEAGAYRTEWWVKGLTAGAYTVTAALERRDGGVKTANDKFVICGGESECGMGGEP